MFIHISFDNVQQDIFDLVSKKIEIKLGTWANLYMPGIKSVRFKNSLHAHLCISAFVNRGMYSNTQFMTVIKSSSKLPGKKLS